MTKSIVVGSSKWDSKARKLIDSKKPLSLVVKGIEAGAAWEALKNATSRDWAKRTTQSRPKEPVTVSLTIVICLAVLAGIGLGVMAAVCIYGMHKGYNIRAKHRVTGPMIWDHRLEFVLVPPARSLNT